PPFNALVNLGTPEHGLGDGTPGDSACRKIPIPKDVLRCLPDEPIALFAGGERHFGLLALRDVPREGNDRHPGSRTTNPIDVGQEPAARAIYLERILERLGSPGGIYAQHHRGERRALFWTEHILERLA